MPAEPPSVTCAVPNWHPGDGMPLGRKTLRIVRVRADGADEPPVLVVEAMAERVTSRRREQGVA